MNDELGLRNLTNEKNSFLPRCLAWYLVSSFIKLTFLMQKRLLPFLVGSILFFNGLSQETDHAWLETSQLKVRINADGRLFCDDEKGAFLVPKGDSMVSLMRGAGLWFGGIDPGRNLCFSAQTYSPVKTDIVDGFRGIPNSGRVWKVTREEIEAHRQDYLDNWVVDNPIPSIFGWPAFRNPFFSEYNGFELPDSMALFPFQDDWNRNERYEPHRGEFPLLFVRSFYSGWQIPSEMVGFVFNTDASRLLSNCIRPFPVQVWGQAAVFDCPENDILSRSVIVQYAWRNEGVYQLDSANVSVFNDIDLGDPKDDYHGCIPNRSAYFAYNADNMDAVWQSETPLLFINPVYSPWGFQIDNQTWNQLGLMPYGGPNTGGGTGEATAPNQYYNYMTGTWRDNTPLTVGGTGYAPGNPNAPKTEIAFPGYPDSTGGWTELNAHNPSGNRRALVNFDLGVETPKGGNIIALQYSYMPWEAGTLTQRIKHWEAEQEYLWDRLNCCIDANVPFQHIGCEYFPPSKLQPEPWSVFPNPANDVLRVWHPGIYLRKMLLYDALGRVMDVGAYRDQYSEILVQQLPAGMYFLHIEDENGEKKTAKVMVAH